MICRAGSVLSNATRRSPHANSTVGERPPHFECRRLFHHGAHGGISRAAYECHQLFESKDVAIVYITTTTGCIANENLQSKW